MLQNPVKSLLLNKFITKSIVIQSEVNEVSVKNLIDSSKVPVHVAIIMDGNGRWAKEKGKARVYGHKSGVNSVRQVTEAAAEIGIKYLTLYAFSTENWNRPRIEVEALMFLLVDTIRNEISSLNKNNIRLMTIGDTSALPASTRVELEKGIEATSNNTGLNLILALNYSGRDEITAAVKHIAKDVVAGIIHADDIHADLIHYYLYTKVIPDPELIIRTSGENRISNFLLWQCAYSEFYFTSVLWPDFTKEDFFRAILNFQQRERRFGKTSEQIQLPE